MYVDATLRREQLQGMAGSSTRRTWLEAFQPCSKSNPESYVLNGGAGPWRRRRCRHQPRHQAGRWRLPPASPSSGEAPCGLIRSSLAVPAMADGLHPLIVIEQPAGRGQEAARVCPQQEQHFAAVWHAEWRISGQHTAGGTCCNDSCSKCTSLGHPPPVCSPQERHPAAAKCAGRGAGGWHAVGCGGRQ